MRKNIALLMLITFLLPSLSFAETNNISVEARANAKVESNIETKLNDRRIELQKRLFKEEVSDIRSEFQKAREEYKESSDSNKEEREMKKKEFRAKFAERFKFTLDKLSDFQKRMEIKLDAESKAGVDVSKSKIKLDESISFMSKIEADIASLKAILDKDYTEEQRDSKKKEAGDLVEKIKTNIKASHSTLKESLKELRIAKSIEVKSEVKVEASN